MKKREIGEKYFKEGYNCCQSVVLAFIDELNIDKKTALLICSSFGGGMGRLREVCGAVTGMFIVLGLKEGYYETEDLNKKHSHYINIQKLAKDFQEKNGSYICRELLNLNEKISQPLPANRTEKYYTKRPCVLLVGDAIEILQSYLNE